MKKSIFFVLIMAIGTVSSVFGQFTFSVAPGVNLNSASFGYKLNDKVVPYFGLQVLHIKANTDYSWEELDYYTGQVHQNSDKMELKGNIIIPNLGLKYFVSEKNKLKSYLDLNLSKPLIMAKVDGEDLDQDEVDDFLKKLKLFGAEVGFGVEYFFDEDFSIGGEFGIRFFSAKFKDSHSHTEYDYYGYEHNLEEEISAKIKINPTFSKIALNFYF